LSNIKNTDNNAQNTLEMNINSDEDVWESTVPFNWCLTQDFCVESCTNFLDSVYTQTCSSLFLSLSHLLRFPWWL